MTKYKSILAIGIYLLLNATISIGQDFTAIEAKASNLNLRNPTSKRLANAIEGLSSDPTEQLRALYVYIGNNIKYDVDGFFSGKPSPNEPDEVLRRKRAVCEGYSNLFVDVARQMGIEAHVVSGVGKGFGFKGKIPARSDHAWVAVKLKGEWKLIDPTWGAGYLNQAGKYQMHFQPRYFFTPPERFIVDHLPEDPVWQLLPCPLSEKEFLADSTTILKRATQCSTPTFHFNDTLQVHFSMPEEQRILNQAARIARNADFGLISAAIMVLNMGSEQSAILNEDSVSLTVRLNEAKRIRAMYSIPLGYVARSKAPEASQVKQVINGNVQQLDSFIKQVEAFLAR